MGKKPTKKNPNIHTEDVAIEEHINTHYRDFSYYTLSSRGIPSQYDGLTNVQRMILLNAPDKLASTNSLIGECFKAGYHHGDASLAGAINRLCRSFDNSYSLLSGDGFFGNSLANASQPRYTKCKIDGRIKKMIEKYSPINEYDFEGYCKFINLDAPIGLCTSVIGIAIAYRSQILPRKLDDMIRYLDGDENVQLKPHFEGFDGKIRRNPKNKNAWIISSDIKYDPKKKAIIIRDLPPMKRYDTFLEKLIKLSDKDDGKFISEIMEASGNRKKSPTIKIVNNSKTKVDISLKLRGFNKEAVGKLIEEVEKISSISVPEEFLFADGTDTIVKYETIKDYLDDFKVFRNRSILRKMQWDRDELIFERNYNQYKLKFIRFMSDKRRSRGDVKKWMDVVDRDFDEDMASRVKSRLKSIAAYNITEETMKEAKEKYNDLVKQVKKMNRDIKKFQKNNTFDLSKSKAVDLVKTSS